MSSRRSRSGGQVDRHHRQPEVQVLAELAALDLGLQVAVGRGDDAHVDAISLLPPTRRISPRLEHAQQLGLQLERQLADLVEEQRAAAAPARTRPARRSSAPVNAPFSWPNSSLSISDATSAPQSTTTNGACLRRLCAWTARASTSLPVPVSPPISTVASVGAMRSSSPKISRIAGSVPTSIAEAVALARQQLDALGDRCAP